MISLASIIVSNRSGKFARASLTIIERKLNYEMPTFGDYKLTVVRVIVPGRSVLSPPPLSLDGRINTTHTVCASVVAI